ncbi:MAG TPA: hypothetical protein VEF04_10895, partial [Blastocatellia bacterium]|nr:hypothetical protein [Blastocatellia bacterium]
MVKQQPTNIAQWAIRDGLIIAFYVLAMWVTDAHFMGDAPYYVESIVKRYEGVSPDFWEFGHLYWRPFGYVLSRLLMPLTSAIVGTDLRLNVTYSLMAFNWCCGLVAALCLYRWVRNVARREWI